MLGARTVEVQERQYFKQRLTPQEVRALASKLPGGVEAMLSTRSRRFKELGLADKRLTEEEIIALLADEPGLWRRPIIVVGESGVIGYDEQRIEALLR